jgi:hypothetical protein
MAEDEKGWISLHRKIQGHWVWQDDKTFKIWVSFLMKANHQDNKFFFDGNIFEVERGSFVTSLKKLAKEFGCSIGKIRRVLILFENDSMIELKTDTKKTQITICNYDDYQDSQHTKSTQKAHQKHTKSTQTETNNNDNNENNDNKREKDVPAVEPNITDKIQLLWIRTWGRNPNIPEREETERLIQKFGDEKVLRIMRKSALRNFKNFDKLISCLDENGNIKELEYGHGGSTFGNRNGNKKPVGEFDITDPGGYKYETFGKK